MPENYEVIYTHPSGATATFVRHDGELDALAKGLDAEQFWVFKNVKSLLVRNEETDLVEANQMMNRVGFSATVREITAPQPVATVPAAVPEILVADEHAGPHLPGPSYWPLLLAGAATFAFIGLILWDNILPGIVALPIAGIGLILTFVTIIGFGLEPA